MLRKSVWALADRLAESLMDQVSIGRVGEELADEMASSIADELGAGADAAESDIAEALAHLGCSPDVIHDMIHTGLTRIAGRASLLLASGPLPDGMPVDAENAIRRVKAAAKAKEAG